MDITNCNIAFSGMNKETSAALVALAEAIKANAEAVAAVAAAMGTSGPNNCVGIRVDASKELES